MRKRESFVFLFQIDFLFTNIHMVEGSFLPTQTDEVVLDGKLDSFVL